MTEPQQGPPAPQQPGAAEPPPEPAVVEWGSARSAGWAQLADRDWWSRRFGWHRGAAWWRRLAWVLAGLGALALFGSLVGEWQVVHQEARGLELPGEQSDPEQVTFGVGAILVWGTGWLVGALLIAACCALALAGQPPVRRHARTIGLALAGVELGMLVAAAMELTQESLFVVVRADLEISLGRGVYAAFASVVLLGGALFVAGQDSGSGPEDTGSASAAAAGWPPGSAGPPAPAYQEPADLTVAPAEPFAHPDGHHWR